MCRVQTKLGFIKGQRYEGYEVFKGVPYAKPPIGSLRFKHAEPVEPWQGEWDATTWGSVPVQPPNSLEDFFAVAHHTFTQSEDCLYLNIWRPQRKVKHPLPVIIYFYGGSFLNGHGSQDVYHPHEIVKQEDVIVVTFNYRLGAFGFLDWSTINADWDKNNGLSDQICAIQWVAQNIEAFGGNPNHISLMGQSAGAMSIEVLLRLPDVRPYIQNAVLLSGILHIDTLEDGVRKAHEFSELRAQYFKDQSFETLSQEDILKLMDKLQAQHGPSKGLELLYQPIETEAMDADYQHVQVPILFSMTEAEGDIYIASEEKRLPIDQFQAVVERGGLEVPDRNEIQTAQQQRDYITEHHFKRPYQQLLAELSKHTTVWPYTFNWSHPSHPAYASPYHILDVIFWMGRLDILEANGATVSDKERQLSRHMIHQLCQFVKTGQLES
ncbi:carboxylesterase family protein [Staphylococcus canis]|uniref:Carboxylic ester hydrolase n=1 Tax=Staphylococcus canis TaxID=2724942 RepID=A0ABS0T8Y4_9STAP|nr:carboxylesterase family protein [Staphylococcus canis]MBI5975020.1 carboxylesterase/lipase family protein [Staphylococcus canis]